MQRYIVPINLSIPYPLNRAQVYRALLHQDSMTLQNADVPSANWPSQIKPKCTVPYYTKTVLPIDKCRHTQGRQTPSPPANWTQVYRALLHQYSMTWQNADITSDNVSPNWAQLYRALLHQDSMTYWIMQRYLLLIDTPTNQAHIYRILLHQDSMTYYRMHCYVVPIHTPC